MAKKGQKVTAVRPQETPQVATAQPNTPTNLIAGLIVFIVAILVYANTFGHGFVLDDPLAIGLNKNVTRGFQGIGDIISGSYRENSLGGQLYRPVALIQFAIEWGISPNNPFIHHLFNVLWYGVVALMVFLVMDRWFDGKGKAAAFAAALIFAVHPLHSEVVANIKSRDEIMSLLFVLLAFWLFSGHLKKGNATNLVLSIVCFFLALVSKEGAVMMLPVFGMTAWWLHGRSTAESVKKGALFLIPVMLMFLIRYAIFGNTPAPAINIMDNPIVGATGWGERLGTSMTVLLKYLVMMVVPYPLSSDYSYLAFPLTGLGNIKAIAGLLVYAGLLIFAVRGIKRSNFLSLAIFGFLFAVFLYSQIPVIIGTLYGERLGFLPSFWFIGGIVYAISGIIGKSDSPSGSFASIVSGNKIFIGGILTLSLIYGFMTINRNPDWRDNFTLFTTDVAKFPMSVRLNNGAAEELIKAANPDIRSEKECSDLLARAEAHCQAIMKIKPVATAYLSMANIRLMQKKYDEAITYYDQVNDLKKIVDTGKAMAYREMGRQAGEKENDLAKSREMLGKSLALNAEDGETWFLMGVSFGVAGDHLKAAEYFEKAYGLNRDPNCARNAAMAYRNAGLPEKAAAFEKLVGQ